MLNLKNKKTKTSLIILLIVFFIVFYNFIQEDEGKIIVQSGLNYQKQENYEKAKEYYYQSLELGEYSLAYENLSSILLSERNNKEALKIAEEGFLKFPLNENLRKFLIIAYYRNGEIGKAINLTLEILEEEPQNEEAHYLYEMIMTKQDIKI